MKYVLFIMFLGLYLSCRSSFGAFGDRFENANFRIDLSEGYDFQSVTAEGKYEYLFKYQDSSIVYVTSFDNPPTYGFLREQVYFYEMYEAIHCNDTIVHKGSNDGMYWLNRRVPGYSIGYMNVQAEDLANSNLVISSFRVK